MISCVKQVCTSLTAKAAMQFVLWKFLVSDVLFIDGIYSSAASYDDAGRIVLCI
jgi:hypothetical protein